MPDEEKAQVAEHTEAHLFTEEMNDSEFDAGLALANDEDETEPEGEETPEGPSPSETEAKKPPKAKAEDKTAVKTEKPPEEEAKAEAAAETVTPDFSTIEDPAERFKARADYFDPLYQAELTKLTKAQEEAAVAQAEAVRTAEPPPPQPLNDKAARFILDSIKPEELPALIDIGKDEDGNEITLDMRRFENDFPEHAQASRLYAGMMSMRMLQKVLKSGKIILQEDMKPIVDQLSNLNARLHRSELWRKVEKTHSGAEDIRQSKEFADWLKTLPEKQRRLADVMLPDIQLDLVSTFKKTQEAGKKVVEHDKKTVAKKKRVDSLRADTLDSTTATPEGKNLSDEEEFMAGFSDV